MPTVREVFETMKGRLASDPNKVANLKASYQFDLTGDGGGLFHADFNNGSYDIGEGPMANPGCTVTMSAADFLSLVQGKLNPAMAFMTGSVKIKGDLSLAMKLQTLLS